ncbi:putative spermidine synthase/polyamine aminopropyltransferase [Candidatus Hepatincolaceae symbiont of Richtersius coronifer]
MKKWFEEKLYKNQDDTIGYKQSLLVNQHFANKTNEYQSIEIFVNPFFGKVLALDGVVQTTEADEFFYHEMFVHVPMFAHGQVKNVLIIGGGDGGILREVLKHKNVKKAIMIELDGDVIDLCKEYMPNLNKGAFADKRAEVQIRDGIDFIKNTNEKFDLILVDSTDPIGAGEVLFSKEFYMNVKRSLNAGGIVITQSGVPFLQPQEFTDIANKLQANFSQLKFYTVPVPTYIGGFMCLGFATDDSIIFNLSLETLAERLKASEITNLKYYNSPIHVASFALPQYILNKILK